MRLLNDSEIEVQMQQEIERAYSQATRERIIRAGTSAEKAALKAFFATMSTKKLAMIAERDLEQGVLDYTQAERRLAQPVLDPKAVDDAGKPMYPTYKDMNGKVQPHPAIAQDKAERASAQYVLNAATPEVTALAAKRLAAQAVV